MEFPERKKINRQPSFLELHKKGELKKRGEALWASMKSCELCFRRCRVNRLKGERGFCGASSKLVVSSCFPHFGEEGALVGKCGSGAIFFSNCSLRCVFCINWEISQEGEGASWGIEHLAEMMMSLQEKGCHNINVVTPTHYLPHILLAVDKAVALGLRLPLVYNTCGVERIEILKMLEGIVDVYLPDFKYSSKEMAAHYSSGAEMYPEVTQAALLEMHRQVGVAKPGSDGLIHKGLIIRHLVMPNNVSGTKAVVAWISRFLSKDTYLNIMSQYMPTYKAFDYPEISRRITQDEYLQAVQYAYECEMTNLDIQGYSSV